MGKWIEKLIKSKTVECFNCFKVVDKKQAFNIKLNTAEGLMSLKACPECAKDVDDTLKALEEVKNGQGL